MFVLKNWYMITSEKYVLAYGYCFGNPKFSEGFFIHTSPVEKTEINLEKGHIICTTKSGSHYCMDFAELDMSYEKETKVAMGYLDISSETFDKCISISQEKEQQLMEKLDKTMEKGDLFLSLVGVNACCAYFKDTSLIKMNIGYHVGMFQDSVLICDLESYKADFRYFPYETAIEPYHTSEGIYRIVVLNDGGEVIFKGSSGEILLKKGKETIIERQYLQQEGLFSPDCTGSAPLLNDLLSEFEGREDN